MTGTGTRGAGGQRTGAPGPASGGPDLETLASIEQRVLWLSTRMIHAANRRGGEVKTGGHQASCASMTSIMTALWFAHLEQGDKVAIKPHAAPVYHAIKYLTGELDASYLTTLRQFGGLQAYPSRTKDPDVEDFSTGSVGLGAVAPLFAALTRRYTDAHFGPQPRARFIATVGDAELDEGNVWEAIADPATAGLGNFLMIVDLNRQSLDRVIPDIAATRLQRFFADAGWHVAEAKYGHKLRDAFARRGGELLQRRLDAMSNEAYQQLFSLSGPDVRAAVVRDADPGLDDYLRNYSDQEVQTLVHDLGGHDLELLVDTFRSCDGVTDQPSVVFAYTIKGHRLPIAGDALNHAALLTDDHIDELRRRSGLTPGNEWDRFDPQSPEGRLCASVGAAINNPTPAKPPVLAAPSHANPAVGEGTTSTQDAFGRALTALATHPGIGERIVTTAPDVSISTSLGGWINKTGVFDPRVREPHGGQHRLLKWAPSPSGRHIELGISEMNLFTLLGQLGLSHDHHGQQLIPIGTVYDPFVLRGLDALIYALYNGSRFIIVGTPSGVTLAPEGGAHQSTITPSIGTELPGLTYYEPAYASEVDWILCHAITQLTAPDGTASYLRLSTRPIDQEPFARALRAHGEMTLRGHVLSGGYRLHEPEPAVDREAVTLITTGALAPEALAAADELHAEGVAASVIHLTSPDLVHRSWQHRYRLATTRGVGVRQPSPLHRLVPPVQRRHPIVTVQDAASHSLAWIGSALGTHQIALGVDQFGESGTIADLHHATGISTGHIVNAALIALHERDRG